MEEHHVQVDSRGPEGLSRRTVKIEGEELAGRRTGDTRGVTETLFETDEGYIVHKVSWSRFEGESSTKDLKGPFSKAEVSKKFPEIARKAEVEVPAELDEVL